MRKTVAAALLAAAVTGVIPAPALLAQSPATPAAENKAGENRPADARGQIPVRQVVLYSSGVGYFEHFGTVTGSGSTGLRFKTQQVNDVLKSLVLQDMDQGRVGVITYPSQDPVARTLRSFQVDITGNPGIAQLLGQLRGAEVSVSAGAETVAGTVLGVEQKPRPVGDGKNGKGGAVVDVWFVNLITDAGGIRSVSLDDVRSFELRDPKLREELNRALGALASARDQDTKPVTINFEGRGERRLRVGYVVETPIWKTSYRLVLGERANPADPKAVPSAGPNLGGGIDVGRGGIDVGGGGVDVDRGPGTRPAVGGGSGTGSLQGWAIVENQTDNDWADVQLSLVSGRPISFIQDLYQPLYVPRPVVQPELYASLRPQTYDAGMAGGRELTKFAKPGSVGQAEGRHLNEAESLREGVARAKRQVEGGANRPASRPAASSPREANDYAGAAGGSGMAPSRDLPAIDAAASIASVASASKVGELFQYTVGNVSLPRQTSAMIPVVTDPVEVERVSIYNLAVLPKNPLLGARVKNTTGKHLLQGPVTVLDGGGYAGDARIDDVPPGQERLISYGVDQQITVQAQNNRQTSNLVTGKIVKGVLHLTHKEVVTQEYVADNKADAAKTLIIEHERLGGEWKLVEPAKADETTDALYRFKGRVEAGKATKLAVRQEQVRREELAVLPMDPDSVVFYSRTGAMPQDVRDALAKAAGLRQALAGTERRVAERQQKVGQITQEQQRLRENLKTVAQNTPYYTRVMKKLDDQESEIEALQKEVATLQAEAEQQRKAYEAYVNGLSVG